MIDKLDVDETMNLMTSNRQFQYKMSDFVRAMILRPNRQPWK
jgi:hypothetical protein